MSERLCVSEHDEAKQAEDGPPPRCPSCGSDRRVNASLTRGMTIINQCVPCGRYYGPAKPGRCW